MCTPYLEHVYTLVVVHNVGAFRAVGGVSEGKQLRTGRDTLQLTGRQGLLQDPHQLPESPMQFAYAHAIMDLGMRLQS